MKNLPFETWLYEEQTRIKHQVFNDYFDKWVKILGKYNNLNYIDGFGGCGAYKDEKDKGKEPYYGSPILAARVIKDNQKHANILVIDKKKENITNLKEIFKYLKLDIKPTFINDTFDHAINKILDEVSNPKPTFFFIDPFGFKGIKYSTLERIMKIKKSEIFMNFMYNGINRFLSLKQNREIMNDLFGISEWETLSKLEGTKKENETVNLYRSQLKKIAKFVFPYRLEFPEMKRTYYYLFHLTNHHKGASIMKSSFAKFNYGRVEYLGVRANQLSLFEIGKAKIEEIEKLLIERYDNKYKKYKEIIEENIDETPYLESEIKQTLKELERKNKAYIERFPKLTEKRQQLRTSIEEKDIIYFNLFPNIKRKTLLYKTKVEYGNFTINHVFGCSHGCNFPCYAMMMAKTYGKIDNYESWIHPKIVSNALDLLEKEIFKYKKEIDFVHLSFTTDPFMYDPINKRTYPQIQKLTLQIIKKLNHAKIKCTLLTKGIYPKELTNTKIYNKENKYGITLVSLDKRFKKEFEPYSPEYDKRIEALKYLHNNGLKTWVSIEPYPTPNTLPSSSTGNDLDKILKKISFVDSIIFGKMNYNTVSTKFRNNEEFYKECVKQIIIFCKKNNIRYYVKKGTPGHDPKKIKIFES